MPDIFINIISCHGFSKSSISKIIFTYCSTLVTNYLYKGFIVVETEEGGLDHIPMSMKMKNCADNLHQEYIIITCKAAIPFIVNTLNKIIIIRDMYENYVYNLYDDLHVGLFNLEL